MVVLQKYDIIVNTADISGCEAAFVSSKMGARVLLITPDIDKIADLYCGNKFGNGEKGIMMREIDALGSIIPKLIDVTGIHFMTNDYFQSPVMLCDRNIFSSVVRNELLKSENLDIIEDELVGITFQNSEIKKLFTQNNNSFETKCLILTTLNDSISKCIEKYGFKIYDSGITTAAVLNFFSISFGDLILQKSVDKPVGFSYMNIKQKNKIVNCWQLKIDKEKIEYLIKKILNNSKLSNIHYLPFNKGSSTESDTEQEVLFCPFGYDDFRVYVEGLEMFLPIDMQKEIVHSLDGCKDAKIIKYGSFIEFRFCNTELKPTLETYRFPGLFLVGLANGTTGYEESAAEGLIAGINAALKIKQKPEFIPPENLSIIGNSLLKSKKVISSSEKRIENNNIRPDNADIRLLHYGCELGLIEPKHYENFLKYKKLLESELQFLKTTTFPGDNVPLATLIKNGMPYKSIRIRLDKIAKRKKIPYNQDYYRDIAPWSWRKIEKEIEYILRNEK